MAKALSVVAHDSVETLRKHISSIGDEGHRKRLRAIIRLKQGVLHGDVAARLGASRTSVCSWIAKYNTGGWKALSPNKGGRSEGNPKWNKDIFDDLAKEIDKGGYWSIPRMQEWVESVKKLSIPEQTIWYHMDRLKYSYKSSRPSPIGGSKEKREAFKKGASPRSWSR